MKLMTPTQYVNRAITEFPTLYAGKGTTPETATFRCMDQLFNVIGNGIRDDEELFEFLAANTKKPYDDYDYRLFTETISFGYSEVNEHGWGVGDSIVCVDSDKHLHPEIKKWLDASPIVKIAPYPNFEKEYSTIYQCPAFMTLGKDWLDAAIKFYEKCREFFMSNDVNTYQYAFPSATKKEEEYLLQDFADRLSKYKSYDAITHAYGGEVEYQGDNYDFLCKRWENEKQRCIKFIDETIGYLITAWMAETTNIEE